MEKNIYKLICLTLPCLIKDDSPETTPPIPSKVKKQHTFESYRRCGRDLPPAGGKPHLQHTMINLWSHETVRESHLKFDKVIFLWKKPWNNLLWMLSCSCFSGSLKLRRTPGFRH